MGANLTPADVECWVREHHASLYRYAFRLGGCAALAEDLTQQTFLIAFVHRGQLRDPKQARGWLFSILRRAWIRSLRKPLTLADDVAADLDELTAVEPDESPVDGELLQRALSKLPDAFRLTLTMYYFEDLSYREIAEALDVRIGTVMSRLARGKDMLRKTLTELDYSAVGHGSSY